MDDEKLTQAELQEMAEAVVAAYCGRTAPNPDGHDTLPCPPPSEDEQDEHDRLEHLAEQIDVYRRACAGELSGNPEFTTIGGLRAPLEAA